MYAPGVYAGVELSGGVPNTIYQVFLMTVFITVIYTVGWMNHHFCKDEKMGKIKKAVCGGLLMLALFLILVEKGTLKSSTSYQCYDYIVSGQADDYKAQMEERLSLLRNPELKNVELPAMNSDQGPLMHMEVMEDPNEWTNTVVKQFFGKESVIEVPRSER